MLLFVILHIEASIKTLKQSHQNLFSFYSTVIEVHRQLHLSK